MSTNSPLESSRRAKVLVQWLIRPSTTLYCVTSLEREQLLQIALSITTSVCRLLHCTCNKRNELCMYHGACNVCAACLRVCNFIMQYTLYLMVGVSSQFILSFRRAIVHRPLPLRPRAHTQFRPAFRILLIILVLLPGKLYTIPKERAELNASLS